MTAAIYPSGVVPWTDRRDNIDIVWGNDPNSLAAEIRAIEAVLGINPQIEKNPVSGPQITYNTVDERISATQRGEPLPVCSLSQTEGFIANGRGAGTNYGLWNVYNENYDPFGMYNGNDITVPETGWYLITSSQWWEWWSFGYVLHSLYIDGVVRRMHRWQWNFPENVADGYWQAFDNIHRDAETHITWQGKLTAGQRIRALSENGTPRTPVRSYQMSIEVSCIRKIDD